VTARKRSYFLVVPSRVEGRAIGEKSVRRLWDNFFCPEFYFRGFCKRDLGKFRLECFVFIHSDTELLYKMQ
jgi:hypothetical protein